MRSFIYSLNEVWVYIKINRSNSTPKLHEPAAAMALDDDAQSHGGEGRRERGEERGEGCAKGKSRG